MYWESSLPPGSYDGWGFGSTAAEKRSICSGLSEKTLEVRLRTTQQRNDGLMFGQRRRRWPNIKPPLDQRLVFAWQVSRINKLSAMPLNVKPDESLNV